MKSITARLSGLGLAGVILAAGAFIAPLENDTNDPAKLAVHADPIGIPTACYGSVKQGLVIGDAFTVEQCDQQFAADLKLHDMQLRNAVKVKLTEQEHTAYLSFHYNVGAFNFKQSTLLSLLNSDMRIDACIELTHACSSSSNTCKGWIYAGGKELVGLRTRRRLERDLCLKGVINANE
ncbi:lysozyme [Rheinheimera salexigens]|uniref:Lysozyme n=1 Tax=Rheinheimera salexigens TaxID=1628148 RepID=A0A1E7Q831_9GAMM|nr:lysozyme [Rheinheimera salexigens]OEY70345.1 hypothetical protein BI198_12760 [Rheinheimera salexigens]